MPFLEERRSVACGDGLVEQHNSRVPRALCFVATYMSHRAPQPLIAPSGRPIDSIQSYQGLILDCMIGGGDGNFVESLWVGRLEQSVAAMGRCVGSEEVQCTRYTTIMLLDETNAACDRPPFFWERQTSAPLFHPPRTEVI